MEKAFLRFWRPRVRSFLVLGWVAALFGSDVAFADVEFGRSRCGMAYPSGDPQIRQQVDSYCNYRDFIKLAAKVSRSEPELPSSPKFADFQKFTLKYQRNVARETTSSAELARVFIVPPKQLKRDQVKKLVARYLSTLRELSIGLEGHLLLHIGMHTSHGDARKYNAKIESALRNLLMDDPTFSSSTYTPHDCDYVSQPINALWANINLFRLVDSYANAIWGEAWEAERAKLLADSGIGSVEEVAEKFASMKFEPPKPPRAIEVEAAAPVATNQERAI